MKPYGLAILDFFHGDTSVEVVEYRDDGVKGELPMRLFFRDPLDVLPLNSLDVRCTENPADLAYQEANRRAGRYVGEVRLQFEYKGEKGTPFGWLYVDPETLADEASKAGWSSEVIERKEDGNYLAKLAHLE